MANFKLTECEICGAVIHKDTELYHERWHAEIERRLRRLERNPS